MWTAGGFFEVQSRRSEGTANRLRGARAFAEIRARRESSNSLILLTDHATRAHI